MSDDVLVEKSGGIARITLNRPAVKNALTTAMCRTVATFFETLPADVETRVVVVDGAGGDFCSGADLRELAGSGVPDDPEQRARDVGSRVRDLSWSLFLALHRVPQPVVASVRGYAVGAGAQFALGADLVVAGRSARFVLPQVKLGHSADHGESWYLPRRVGEGRALQMLLLGDPLDAADAERYGLVNWLVEDAAVADFTDGLARRLAAAATVAVAESKALVRGAAGRTFEAQLEAEALSVATCARSGDFVEAMDAARSRRPPAFRGR